MQHKLKEMTVVKLKVARESNLGVFLDAQTGQTKDDILLHKAQQTREVKVGDEIKVFLYLDPKKRLTASMRVPQMREGQIARVKVINVTGDGVFLNAGAERGIFLPFSEMIGKPEKGDIVWAKLYTDKSGRLAMTMKVSDEMRRASKPAVDVKRGDRLKCSIFNITEAGAFLLSDERYIVFVAQKEIPRRLKCGEEVEVRITYVRDDGRLDGSLREQKEQALSTDAEKILRYMKEENNGFITEKLSPTLINNKFHISKSAFKRAIGHLFKERKIKRVGSGFNINE